VTWRLENNTGIKAEVIMPNLDGTGPEGKGPMTGGCRGKCAILIADSKQELDFLNSRAQTLQTQLKIIRARIKTLERKEAIHK
jgi:chromosome segregation ATPase